MALPNPATGDSIDATDVSDIKDHLEGQAGSTAPYHFRQSSGSLTITLATNDGSNGVVVNDSDDSQVFYIDSNGNVTFSGTLTPTNFTFPTGATPTQTTEAQAVWDTDDDVLTVGDGTTTQLLIPSPTTTAGDMEYADGARSHARVAIGTAGQFWKVNSGATAPEWGSASLEVAAQAFVEDGTYKQFWGAGAPQAVVGYGVNNLVGLGCVVQEQGTGAVTLDTTAGTRFGGWLCSTSTTNNSDAGLVATTQVVANDWTVVWRGVLFSESGQNVVIGGNVQSTDFADANNLIAFRVSGTGTLQGICDNGGTETARDTSFTPDGTTETTLRIEVRSGGTIVRFYKDNTQVGADVTTNIYTSNLQMAAGVTNGTSNADRKIVTHDFFGWREV